MSKVSLQDMYSYLFHFFMVLDRAIDVNEVNSPTNTLYNYHVISHVEYAVLNKANKQCHASN